jgi:hypothetical protein
MIPHLVSAPNYGGEAASENHAMTPVLAGNVSVLGAITMFACAVFVCSLVLLWGESLDLAIPDWTMMTLWHRSTS